jgi:hypothetical protein
MASGDIGYFGSEETFRRISVPDGGFAESFKPDVVPPSLLQNRNLRASWRLDIWKKKPS